MALLEARGLQAQYGWTKVLRGIDFAVEDGGIATVLGANGAGKTTTLRAVCGMVRTAGEIRFAGQRINGRATEDLVRLGIGHAPEGRGTFVNLTVEENLRLGAYGRRGAGSGEDLGRVYQYFPVLAERRRQLAGTLSGGEQQMLAVARGLMARPRLLLLDEPSLGLALRVIYQPTDVVNYAQGEMAMFSTYLAWTLLNAGLPYWVAFGATLVISFVGGLLIERIVIRPVEGAPVLTIVIVCIGLLVILNSIAGWIYSYIQKPFPSPFPSRPIQIGNIYFGAHDLGALGVTLVVLAGLYVFFRFTTLGLAMR